MRLAYFDVKIKTTTEAKSSIVRFFNAYVATCSVTESRCFVSCNLGVLKTGLDDLAEVEGKQQPPGNASSS